MIVAPDPESIHHAALGLAAGALVVLPTETVYGLGADAANREAVAAIFAMKGRPADHPVIVHVLDLEGARWWAALPPAAERLIERFWPGPLTLILKRREDAPAWACAGSDTIGLRAPSEPVARALLAEFALLGGHGIAAPSANRFGRISPTRAEHVADDFGRDSPLILDGGPCLVGVESTIVDLSRGRPVLLRPGAISAAQIAEVLGEVPSAPDADAPRASGTLAAHYAPRTPVELVAAESVVDRANVLSSQLGHLGIVSSRRPDGAVFHVWQPAPADPESYARWLYDGLRGLDRQGLDRLLIERPPPGAAWDAVRDRLSRAAAGFSGTPEGPTGRAKEPT